MGGNHSFFFSQCELARHPEVDKQGAFTKRKNNEFTSSAYVENDLIGQQRTKVCDRRPGNCPRPGDYDFFYLFAYYFARRKLTDNRLYFWQFRHLFLLFCSFALLKK